AANNIDKLTQKLEDAIRASDKWPRSLNEIGKEMKVTLDVLTKGENLMEALDKAITNSGKAFKDGKFSIEAYNKELNKFYNNLDDAGKQLLRMAWEKAGMPQAQIDLITKGTEEYDKLLKKLKDQQWQQDAFKEFFKQFAKLKDTFADFSKDAAAGFILGIKKLATDGGNTFVDGFLKPIGEPFGKIPEIVGRMFSDLGELIARGAAALGQSFMEGFVNPIVEGFKKLWEIIRDFFKGIGEIAQATWDAIVKFFYDNFVKPITEAFDKFKQFCKDTFDNIT